MFGFGKKRAQYDNDPAQQEFTLLILAGATGTSFSDATNFLARQDWSAKEARYRIAHAVSAVQEVVPPDVYKRAKDFGWEMTQASYRLG
jgi:hypothetical protein